MNPEPSEYTARTIKAAAAGWRNDGLTVVFTNGCFDLIHPGHTSYLRQARELGDLLVVGINTDESVTSLKGPGRPILNQAERVEILLSLRWVDAVVPFSEPTPIDLIKAVNPHILVKGGDWPVEKIVGSEFVEASGGRIFSLPFVPGVSTSGIIQRISGSSS
ncbi:MAG: D-glycero-beta-D-manno-heptose 1-phosphate adenylyltransferase [bacterium]